MMKASSPAGLHAVHSGSSEKPHAIVTGASGLIGSRLTDQLAANYQVTAIDVKLPEQKDDRVHFLECDLTDDHDTAEAFERLKKHCDGKVASVLHLAAYYDFSGEPSSLYRELTVEGTSRVLNALKAFDVEQFVFSSTLLLMKPAEDEKPLTESSAVDPEWDYPQSKLEAERLITEKSGAIPTVFVRLAGVYDDNCHSIPIAQQISRIYEKQLESYVYPGDKTHGQSFIHLEDAVDCLCRIVQKRQELAKHEILLAGEEDVMSYEKLQDEIGKQLHGKEWPTIRIPKALAKAGAWVQEKLASNEEDAPFIKPWMIDLADQHYPIDLQHTRDVLQWRPQRTLRNTLPTMLSSLVHDPVNWYKENNLPLPDSLKRTSEMG